MRGLAVAARHAEDWLHLTTRQNVELHWKGDREVEGVLAALARHGLSTHSTCGHTVCNVMCSEDAGVGLDEPFDCFPDTRLISDTLISRSAEPTWCCRRFLNVALGGLPRCRHDALVNDAGLVSIVADGVPGYEMWAGGSLRQGTVAGQVLHLFVLRTDVLAAVEALVDVFVTHGRFDEPAKGRMKFVVADLGADRGLRAAWQEAFDTARDRPHPPVPAVEVLADADRVEILRHVPPGGWSACPAPTHAGPRLGHDRPAPRRHLVRDRLQRDLADRYADSHLTFTRDQNIAFRNVPLAGVAPIRAALAERGVHLLARGRPHRSGPAPAPPCAPWASPSRPGRPAARRERGAAPKLVAAGVRVGLPELVRPAPDRRHRSRGSKVRVNGRTTDGYQVYLGADLDEHEIADVGRVAEADLDAAVTAIVGTWEALRHPGESLGRTVRRFTAEAFSQQITAAPAERWAAGLSRLRPATPSESAVLVS